MYNVFCCDLSAGNSSNNTQSSEPPFSCIPIPCSDEINYCEICRFNWTTVCDMISIAAAAALCYGQWRVLVRLLRACYDCQYRTRRTMIVAKGVCRCGQGVAAPKSWHENILTFQNFGRFFSFVIELHYYRQ